MNKRRLVGIIIAAQLFMILTCGNSFKMIGNSDYIFLNHLDSVEFNGYVYHLTLVSRINHHTDTVYECDTSGVYCKAILNDLGTSVNIDLTQKFVVDTDENHLYVDMNYERALVR